jgi:hypothetical protein
MEPKQVLIKMQSDGQVSFENISGKRTRGVVKISTTMGKFSKRYIRDIAKTLMEIGDERKTHPSSSEKIELIGVSITGTHPYTFRCGKPALITGVKSVCSESTDLRICYEVTFPDGVIDYIPLCDMHNYEMKVVK